MVKYLTKDLILRLNEKAVRLNKNRSIHPNHYSDLNLKEDIKYPVGMTLPTGHMDREMRTQIYLGEDNGSIWLDIEMKDFTKLPSQEIDNE